MYIVYTQVNFTFIILRISSLIGEDILGTTTATSSSIPLPCIRERAFLSLVIRVSQKAEITAKTSILMNRIVTLSMI